MDIAQANAVESPRPEPKTYVSVTFEVEDGANLPELLSKLEEVGSIASLSVNKQGGFYF